MVRDAYPARCYLGSTTGDQLPKSSLPRRGSDDHRDLLIHLLNAILGDEPPTPVTWVEISNRYSERETLDDKLTVVDVKAQDAERQAKEEALAEVARLEALLSQRDDG